MIFSINKAIPIVRYALKILSPRKILIGCFIGQRGMFKTLYLRYIAIGSAEWIAVICNRLFRSTTYNEDFPPKQFFDEITTKVDFHKQLDLSPLKTSKYVVR